MVDEDRLGFSEAAARALAVHAVPADAGAAGDWVVAPAAPAAPVEHGDYMLELEAMETPRARPYTYTTEELYRGHGARSAVIDFLLSCRCVRTRSDHVETEPTHVSMAGASFVIRDDQLDTFVRTYAHALLHGYECFFAERPVREDPAFISRLFMDLDFKGVTRISTRQVHAIVHEVQSTLRAFLPSEAPEALRVIVCGAPYATSADGATVKTGIHLHWPDERCFVTKRQAAQFRATVVARVKERFGDRDPPANPWDDVFDISVIWAAGLRMVGSSKIDTCPACRGKAPAQLTCGTCEASGRVNAGRAYWPLMVLDGNGQRLRAHEERYLAGLEGLQQLVWDTMIRRRARADHVDSAWMVPEHAAPAIDPSPRLEDRARPLLATTRRGGAAGGGGAWITHMPAGLAARFEALIRSHERFDGVYAHAYVRKIQRHGTGARRKFRVLMAGAGSRFCANIGCEHSENHIYFEVTPRGLVQRCWKEDDNAARTLSREACRMFRGPVVPLPSALRTDLFGTLETHARETTVSFHRWFDDARSKVHVDLTARERETDRSAAIHASALTINLLHQSLGWTPWDPTASKTADGSHGGTDASGLGSRGMQACLALGYQDAAGGTHNVAAETQVRVLAERPVHYDDLFRAALHRMQELVEAVCYFHSDVLDAMEEADATLADYAARRERNRRPVDA